MAEARKNPIIKRTQITVLTAELNDYGDMIITDENANEYKISHKRDKFFNMLQPGAQVTLEFASYMNNEYVQSVRLTDSKEPIADKPATKTGELAESKSKIPEIPGQQIGMTVKELGDMIRAKILRDIFGLEIAIELTKWYRSQILGTTRIPFDGARLPKFDKPKEDKKEP